MYRPFFKSSGKEIVRTGLSAALAGDIETATYCLLELAPERRKRSTKYCHLLESVLTLLKVEPIPWLETAFEIAHSYDSESEGNHSVYVVLLCGINVKTPGYGLYVGMTGLTPEDRFNKHKAGYKAGQKWVTRYGRCLLPALYEHLNPMGHDEALSLEADIAKSLTDADIPVYGGH